MRSYEIVVTPASTASANGNPTRRIARDTALPTSASRTCIGVDEYGGRADTDRPRPMNPDGCSPWPPMTLLGIRGVRPRIASLRRTRRFRGILRQTREVDGGIHVTSGAREHRRIEGCPGTRPKRLARPHAWEPFFAPSPEHDRKLALVFGFRRGEQCGEEGLPWDRGGPARFAAREVLFEQADECDLLRVEARAPKHASNLALHAQRPGAHRRAVRLDVRALGEPRRSRLDAWPATRAAGRFSPEPAPQDARGESAHGEPHARVARGARAPRASTVRAGPASTPGPTHRRRSLAHSQGRQALE